MTVHLIKRRPEKNFPRSRHLLKNGCSLVLRSTRISKDTKSIPIGNDLLSDTPWNKVVSKSILQTFTFAGSRDVVAAATRFLSDFRCCGQLQPLLPNPRLNLSGCIRIFS